MNKIVAIVLLLILVIGLVLNNSYKTSINRARVLSAFESLVSLEKTAQNLYAHNQLGTFINWAYVVVNSNILTYVGLDKVEDVLYIAPGDSPDYPANQFILCIFISKLDFDGYVAPTATSSGEKARLCKLVTITDAGLNSQCSVLKDSELDLPRKYRPADCN